MKKHLSILGSTGSIGRNVLNIVAMFPDRFAVAALTAKDNIALLAEQVRRFHPEMAVVYDADRAEALRKLLSDQPDVRIAFGDEGYRSAAGLEAAHMVVGAMMGAAGLKPTLAAIDAGKPIALANKETLVMAGELVMGRAAEKGVDILPVDSEHSAIFQCLSGQRRSDLQKILLTASGGPFLDRAADEFPHIRPEDALKHPNWEMGRKITIDSATLMNKGLEVIEARWLFDVSRADIEVVVHPQSIVHSMVSYRDGSVIAQLGVPDMKGAIAYALSWPERLPLGQPVPDFPGLGALTFRAPDLNRFPCLGLAFEACDAGGTLPAVLNAANEIAVGAFLNRKIVFPGIPDTVRAVMGQHTVIQHPTLSDILEADQWARAQAEDYVNR
ncbi:1-deoxy-D-xylulose 5-phosphate reductoisomerase [Desulfonema ishimotonii]|uniref:1-deoxy-D-xylulose 5-phosphate reductoisomerase n=1 Tax=Desulfonema ishimotonii TaxID=45657 RepID=A0A401FQR1_9BACT|nr:1-deoxy-D-xylulose-5-phosphate reductoisomerase [Desulfonema ishimotonii]GBC59301.1 1-deoxy-D-xylulose 5-phosphate reductoisomerase [Desulfonema ishimotonii]